MTHSSSEDQILVVFPLFTYLEKHLDFSTAIDAFHSGVHLVQNEWSAGYVDTMYWSLIFNCTFSIIFIVCFHIMQIYTLCVFFIMT